MGMGLAPRLAELSGSELLELIHAAVGELADSGRRLTSDREQLALLAEVSRIEARLHAWRAVTAAHLDAGEVAVRAHGTALVTWLGDRLSLTRREAARLVRQGQELVRFPVVAAAASAGSVLSEQAEAITAVLADLPEDLPGPVVAAAQDTMVGYAATHNSRELRLLSRHLQEVVDPVGAEEREAARLERDERIARRNRHLRFSLDHHGSVLIRGSLPVAAAEPFVRMVEAYAAQRKRALDAADPIAEYVTAGMRRADGLLALVEHHQQAAAAPSHGGDRPRIVVTMTYETLRRAATRASVPGSDRVGTASTSASGHLSLYDGQLAGALTGSGQPLAAGVLRRLLCDAEVLPVVLGGASGVLDVGRSARLVTPTIRVSLETRDRGCVFPGCDRPPQDCHAHHLIPWWAGGTTSLANLVMVCAHHHGIVEPGHDPTADRWKARLGPDGIPEVIPPRRVDPHQRPRRHARYHPATLPPAA